MGEKEKPESVKEEETKAEIVQVPTEYQLGVKLETGEVVSSLELNVRIYNLLLKIAKVL